MKQNFSNTQELVNIGRNLDRAESTTVSVASPNVIEQEAKDYQGVWNLDRKALACIATKHYKIVQHAELLNAIGEELQTLGLSVFGSVKQQKDTMVCELSFQSSLVDDKAKGINMGIRLVNSYNKTKGINGELFGFRKVCNNGMFLGKTFTGVTMHHVHTGKLELLSTVRLFLLEAIDSNTALAKYVGDAMTDTYEWTLANKFLEQAVKIDKWRKLIQKELLLLNKETYTRWDVYNALTAVATHHQRIGLCAEQYLQEKAQLVLIAPLQLEVGD